MANSYHALFAHVAFSTQGRVAWLSEAKLADVHAFIAGVARKLKCEAIIIGGTENHVHGLVRVPTTVCAADLVKEMKRVSGGWLNQRGVAGGKFHWQVGYGAFSVSRWDVAKIAQYIADQETHHRKMTWEEEYRKLLKRHGVEYDPRYYLD